MNAIINLLQLTEGKWRQQLTPSVTKIPRHEFGDRDEVANGFGGGPVDLIFNDPIQIKLNGQEII